MIWMFLLAAGILYCFGCWLTYANEYKEKSWYIPIGICFGAVLSGIWYWAAKILIDKDKMFVFSLTWDAIMIGIYYVLPLLFFGAKLDKWGWVALILILSGVIILKIKC